MNYGFLSELVIKPGKKDGLWVLVEPLRYMSRLYKEQIVIPAGFVTDFASVPRVPIAYWFYGDRAHRESVLHDFLFQKHLVGFNLANRIFLEAMKSRKKPWCIRWPMYVGVKFGGGWAYKSGPDRFFVLN